MTLPSPAPAPPKPAARKRPKSKSPTQRALADLKALGFVCGVVEKWNPHAKIRQDLFGCIDIVAMFPGVGVVGVQATGGGNHAARRTKAMAEPRLRTWLASGGRFEVWSYDLRGKAGARKLYTLRRQEITLDDLPAEPLAEDGPGLEDLCREGDL